ncbi:MAG: carboxypeptidase regulatory-like domain-containing protein, partial [Candidatus Freyarchaeota archaeon]|nr:carboxypeptidase regulatory-like domain-containing protein [Candidatus Jordarchaeia archaeon]
MNYNGGRAFYNYMTRGPGYFAHIDLAIGMPDVWNWGGMRNFLKGLLDSADAENGICEVSITLYGMNLGWEGLWEASFAELLDAIGPNRSSMRFILLAGEWSYKNMQPPTDVNKLKSDFLKAKEIAANYGYELGWHGEGKYLWSLPKETWSEVISWGPRMVDGQLSRSSDPTIGAREAYETGNAPPSATDVLLCCFTMWDREANIPNTPPYYITYEKFAEFVHGAAYRFDATNGAYPQSLVFEVMPETFNDVEGVNCPYLDWWFGEGKIADTYDLRTSRTPPAPIPKPPPVPIPPSPFPPYPVGVKIENEDQNLPPFQIQIGEQFYGSIYARNLHTWGAMGGVPVDVYLAKVNLKSGIWNSYPLTEEQYAQKIFVGRVTTRSDGWAFFNFTAPSETGKYILMAQVPRTETTLEGVSDFIEFLLVATKTHRIEIRTNTKIKLTFGPSAYGPPWQGVDPERWIEPEKPLWGYCGEMEWKFIVPSKVTDNQGKTWFFSHWENGSTNPVRTIFVGRDLVMEAYYSESGAKSKINIHGSVGDDRSYPLKGASVTVSSPVEQVSAMTDSEGRYSVTLSVNGAGDTIRVTASYHGRTGTASNTVLNEALSMQINVTVPRTTANISCSVSSSTVTIGGSITISGVISPTVGETIVTLTYTKPDASLFTRTVTTSPNGAYSDNGGDSV